MRQLNGALEGGLGEMQRTLMRQTSQFWLLRKPLMGKLLLPMRPFSYDSFFTYNLQWRPYLKSVAQVCKIRKTGLSHSSHSSSPLHSFSPSVSFSSSSSSSKSKILFVEWYLRKLESRPLLTKNISSCLIYMAADLTSQMITMSFDDSIDKTRTLRMGAYGLLILGPSQHLWFNFMSAVLPKRDMLSTFKKIFLGQAVYGPSITSVFFSYNASLQGENGREIRGRLRRDLLPTLLNGLLYWPVCDFLTYKFVPVHLQPLMNSSCSYVWTIYLTYKASLEKVSSSEE